MIHATEPWPEHQCLVEQAVHPAQPEKLPLVKDAPPLAPQLRELTLSGPFNGLDYEDTCL